VDFLARDRSGPEVGQLEQCVSKNHGVVDRVRHAQTDREERRPPRTGDGQLMEAAERLFVQQGVAGTSLQDLADAIGLTRTSVYHYVRNKDEMLEALVRDFTLETAEDLRRLAADTGSPAIDRLREAIRNTAFKVAQNPRRFRLILTVRARSRRHSTSNIGRLGGRPWPRSWTWSSKPS